MVHTSTPGGLTTTVVSGRKLCFSRQPQLEWTPTLQSMFVLTGYLFIMKIVHSTHINDNWEHIVTFYCCYMCHVGVLCCCLFICKVTCWSVWLLSIGKWQIGCHKGIVFCNEFLWGCVGKILLCLQSFIKLVYIKKNLCGYLEGQPNESTTRLPLNITIPG